ncbi:oxidoreductase [Marinobacterium nitratireducens]|uniref:Oxidoreductase n=1 Tax=Marinobacterium nitratireducens TaxID=518897 RepID=A0A917ZNU2_9GAMM|nr:FAD-dependent oxidoreductase [Marinobacterium nitratireducens]GGO87337.1 oxidoreductase [Marinobacterium nitratireducens]
MAERRYDLIVVGAGQAAAQLLQALHRLGWRGSILLLGEEPELPYQRPPLSKEFLQGDYDEKRLGVRPQSFYDRAGVRFLAGIRAATIDRNGHRVVAESGEAFVYDRLVLTTGARVRRLQVPGSDLDGVCYLHTLADARALKSRFERSRRLAVVGGGFIGLEVAAVARERGVEVLVLEAQERLMARALTPSMSDYFASLHRRHGVEVRLDCQLERIDGSQGRVSALVTSGKETLAADLVVAGIGVQPNQELASACGLECDNGIAVDEFGSTSDSDIFAAGDCASHPDRRLGCRVRLESVQNATDQAAALAKALTGESCPYDALPWFWSHQYDVRLQMAGLSLGRDREVLRGDPAKDRFSLFSFRNGRLLAVDSINAPRDHSLARRLLSRGNSLTPEQAADAEFALERALAED